VKIGGIKAKRILDSAGGWTIETSIELDSGIKATASVPSGVSTSPYAAKNVAADQAVKNINNIVAKAFQGSDPQNQAAVDRRLIELDGSADKSTLGANAVLSVSLAFAKATAKNQKIALFQYIDNLLDDQRSFKLPQLLVLLFEGGKHGSGKLQSQEFMTIADDVSDGLKMYTSVKKHLEENGASLSVGLEGAFTPDFDDAAALKTLHNILGGRPLAVDVAFESRKGRAPDYRHFIDSLNLKLIEDPFGAEDWDSWAEFTKTEGSRITIVADDLTATNVNRLKEAVRRGSANAVVIKPNQIGSLTETLQAVRLAKESGWKVIVSHRGHETNDDFIADLAVGVGADFVKFGGFARGERIAKYNRLLQIQSEIA
jgi:enolase